MGEATIDLGSHDLALRGGVVVPTEEGAGEILACELKFRDRRAESLEALPRDRLPICRVAVPRTPVMSSSESPASWSIPMNTSRRNVDSRYRRCPDCHVSGFSRPRRS